LKIGEAADQFSELTTLVERSLYSPYAPEEKDLQETENLTSAIRRILSGGIS
jgi:hypothetical protein